ncbi:MAG: pyrroline-5-carboxylate reductase [Burkholderiales bacterium]|nr:pyrroline-5-carboxylate reductase [Burkholderiales bacterium]
MNIAFIGGGNMATALIGGMKGKGFDAAAVTVVEISTEGRERLARELGVRAIPAADASLARCQMLVMAVKPQNMREAAQAVAPFLAGQTVLSIAAGTRLADLSRWLGGHAKLVRTMPNTPALIGAGITALYAPDGVEVSRRMDAERVLSAVGQTVWVEREDLLDPVTALSGSGPAYVFYFLEALQAGGAALGLAPDTARRLALQTVVGAAQLAAASPEDFATLRERVTSKGGTTAAALEVMRRHDLAGAIAAAMRAASERGREMGETLGKD